MKKLIQKFNPYLDLMRLNKPIGIFLLLWPTFWALWIASKGTPSLFFLCIFMAGVIIMRSAGCVINDIADRKFDAQVTRTRHRPLASGLIKTKFALILFLSLCLLGFFLVLQLNHFTIVLACFAVLLATIYPFMKRVTHFPQLVLGAAFAWSVPMVFAAINNSVSKMSWCLFLVAFLWPIAYDTIYALMDKEDDLKAGIKSTAILFNTWDIPLILSIQGLVLGGLALIGYWLQFNLFYYLSLVASLGIVLYQAYLMRQRNFTTYYKAFYTNHWFGAIVFLGIVLGQR